LVETPLLIGSFRGTASLSTTTSPSCKEYISISWRGGLRG